jgi:formylglycine-generating enzyme required for sulfatase activity
MGENENDDKYLYFDKYKLNITQAQWTAIMGDHSWYITSWGPACYNEKPGHRVNISKPFYLGKYEVTQAQWKEVMGNNPSYFKGRDNPVVDVSWYDAQEFIKRLNEKEGHTRYRLPTEAEWEYACRAGTTSEYSFGDDRDSLGRYAWYEDNSEHKIHPVGQKEPNAWCLYDMHGNVLEWVQDWYDGEYYSHSPSTDPTGPSSGLSHVLRGGGWCHSARDCRSVCRYGDSPDFRTNLFGVRLALSGVADGGADDSARVDFVLKGTSDTSVR